MKHPKLKVIMLLYLIVVTVCAFILALLQRSISMNIGVLLLIIFIAAIPVAVGIFKIMIALEMKKPYAARDIADYFAEEFEKFSDWKKFRGE